MQLLTATLAYAQNVSFAQFDSKQLLLHCAVLSIAADCKASLSIGLLLSVTIVM
jgi:hypothetical protein